MQVQPIYFSNGLLATSKIFVSDGPGHAKKSNFFFFWPGEGGIDPSQKMLRRIIWLWQTPSVCCILEVTFLFYV